MIKSLVVPLLLSGSLLAAVCTTQAKDAKTKESATSVAAPLKVALSNKADGPAATAFGAGEAAIFATYHGEKLTKGDKIRFVWTLEDGGQKYNPNSKLSEFTSVADGPEGKGFSQLLKPADGWPVGKYRVDVYVNTAKATSIKFTIK